jgi:hypothetical protein
MRPQNGIFHDWRGDASGRIARTVARLIQNIDQSGITGITDHSRQVPPEARKRQIRHRAVLHELMQIEIAATPQVSG